MLEFALGLILVPIGIASVVLCTCIVVGSIKGVVKMFKQ